MPIQYPLINGTRHEWSSIEIKLDGITYVGVSSINYSDKLEPQKVRGTHPKPIGRTRGEYDAEGSIELYIAEAAVFRKALADKVGGNGYKEVAFDIVVQYGESEFDTITDTVVGARIKTDAGGGAKGPDPLATKWDLDVMNILWNGIDSLINPNPGEGVSQ